MKWWYEPQREVYKWNSLNEVAFAIASTCRLKIEKHRVQNYYIYNDEGLYDIIKASDLDIYSIYANRWSKEEQEYLLSLNLREVRSSIEDELEFLKSQIMRTKERDICDLKLIKAYKDKIRRGNKMLSRELLIKEYQMKYNQAHEISCNIKQTYILDNNRDFENLEDITKLINDIYDLKNATEEYSYSVAFDLNMNLLGILPLSHGNDERCIIDPKILFRFLLLVGANQFVLYHNHSSNIMKMSNADKKITFELLEVSEYLNINMLEHIIICRDGTVNCVEEIKKDLIELEEIQ